MRLVRESETVTRKINMTILYIQRHGYDQRQRERNVDPYKRKFQKYTIHVTAFKKFMLSINERVKTEVNSHFLGRQRHASTKTFPLQRDLNFSVTWLLTQQGLPTYKKYICLNSENNRLRKKGQKMILRQLKIKKSHLSPSHHQRRNVI